MSDPETNGDDAGALALGAIGWIVAVPDRAARFLALTGLDAAGLRARLEDPALLAAAIGFLEAHEPDLIACTQALETTPQAMLSARRELENRCAPC
ncbi:DUF3572 domain-containing protein [Stakelama sediminis]|uniref:DUF3572 family protein n=1 Tax=Stakelama sediminis TaxID=463200 RepID=A0A840YVU7_9SPHN|nr:DUF3572 family protein [Stakelama sediminis]MBB5717831.1 hypothetical protein [Stakelama sediminis]